MKKAASNPRIIYSISELHRLLSLPKPKHPLVSLINVTDIKETETSGSFIYNFYLVCIKKDFNGKIKYGQNYYDFDEGIMSFISPGQVLATDTRAAAGWLLIIHPDFIQSYSLAQSIKAYGYFSYAVNEALHLSEKEEGMIETILKHIEQEYSSVIDPYSQDVIVAQLELLLRYCNRFYNRQFITRKHASNELLIKLEALLTAYFNGPAARERGLPTVQYISGELNVSANYLSDMLRTLTGQNTQQHIHNKLIEKAKEILAGTSLSVSETAYQLGFEHPQSFNKLFKSKTRVSPLTFRHSFN